MTWMMLDLYFWAENASQARQQARAWCEAEPAVESWRIVKARRVQPTSLRWTVKVRLVFRETYEQTPLGLAAQ